MKYLKRGGVYEICALAIIMVGSLLRVLLAAFHWPLLNSDEGTMGIMALHIAYRGERPIFYYGQNYMGVLDAYLGAGLFHVFGPSIFTLRLGIILLFLLFMVAMYFLTSMLYTKRLALVSLVLLSLGSVPLLTLEMSPLGGYPEILFFGACAFLLSSWLALSYNQDVSTRRLWLRLLGYACWGCVAGLAIWSDPLILPYLAGASLVLVVFCWRELLLKWGGICLLLGLIVGLSPLIMYNLKAQPGQDSLSIFLAQTHLVGSAPDHLTPLSVHIVNTLLYDLPNATGNPLCPIFSPVFVTTPGLRCTIVYAGWSLGLIALWLVAALLALQALLKFKHCFRELPASSEQKRTIIREFARLMLLASAGVTTLFFTLSASSIPPSVGNSRYLHCLLISLPAFIWPLWMSATKVEPSLASLRKFKVALSRAMLLLICSAFLAGTIVAFFDIHTISTLDYQHEAMLHKLESMDIKHFYTEDYWTCYRIAFASGDTISCAVIESNLGLGTSNRNRYWSYVLQVQADPHAAYLLPLNDPRTPLIVRNAHLTNGKYYNVELYGYVIYQPRS